MRHFLLFFFPTTFMLRVSFSPVPECVVTWLLESSFSDPPRAPGTLLLLLLLLLCWTKQIGLLFGLLSETPLSLHNDNYAKVIYNIGTEILMLTSNLHNAALSGPILIIFSVICTKFRALKHGLYDSAVGAT